MKLETVKAAVARAMGRAGLKGCRVFIFGSVARGCVWRGSDLDIGILFDGDPDWKAVARLREELEESLLPYRADVVVLNNADPDFAARVYAEGIPVCSSAGV